MPVGYEGWVVKTGAHKPLEGLRCPPKTRGRHHKGPERHVLRTFSSPGPSYAGWWERGVARATVGTSPVESSDCGQGQSRAVPCSRDIAASDLRAVGQASSHSTAGEIYCPGGPEGRAWPVLWSSSTDQRAGLQGLRRRSQRWPVGQGWRYLQAHPPPERQGYPGTPQGCGRGTVDREVQN